MNTEDFTTHITRMVDSVFFSFHRKASGHKIQLCYTYITAYNGNHQNCMDFPKPPPLPSNSDLLARISNFLPKIEAANEELEKTRDKDISTIDCGLVRDDESDNDNDDDDAEDEEDESSEPTIQLKVQIADMEKNKEIFDLLAAPSDMAKDDTVGCASDEDPLSGKDKALANLLKGDEKPSKKSKVLIEEIS